MKKKIFLLLVAATMSMAVMAQRHTDRLDRGLVVIPTGSTTGSNTNTVTWRRLTNEYFDVKYNVYRNGSRVATNLANTCYSGSGSTTDAYQVAAVVNGVEQAKSQAVTAWKQYVYKIGDTRTATAYLDIPLAAVYDRDGNDVTEHYQPNDAEMADLDGDGQLEIIVKRLNTVDATGYYSGLNDAKGNERWIIYPQSSREFVVLDAYDVDWLTGEAALLWRIDCGPNMVSSNSTEIDIIAYDWDEDGRAEVVLRGADNMIVYGSDGTTQLFTVGDMTVNTRPVWYSSNEKGSATGSLAYTNTGAEYLIYMNGLTGAKYQVTDYPLARGSAADWGDTSGHRSSKYFFGAPFLDGRKASLFLGRGIYTRHKMMAMDLDRGAHTWSTRWTWACNNSNSPWYGNGYHNFVIADVDEDGRDEIVYGSMVIDDNGCGLSTTGYGHGDAQHVGDFDPYRPGLEFFGCLEEGPYYGCNYRNATTGEVYYKFTAGDDTGRGLMANFSNSYPGSLGRSSSSDVMSAVTDQEIAALAGDGYIAWGDLNFRIYWDGDLCSEILNSPGTAKEAKVEKPGTGRLFTSSGCNMNNDSKNNPCFQGDIVGDWREEIVVRCGQGLRVYTSGIGTNYSMPTLWNDHQYRQAMVWQMMAYNQPPHLSYFLGEMEGITTAPPTLTDDGRTIVDDGSTISGTSADQLLMCETADMTVSVSDGASPAVLVVNAPTWVKGTDVNGTTGTKVKGDGSTGATNLPEIVTTTYTHTLTGGAFTGAMRLVKQGGGVLRLPAVNETYTGATDVWAGTLRFDGTMTGSAVWLNRHTTLESDGGTFAKSITADYGSAIAPGSKGITVGTLTLNHGARLVITLYGDITASKVNADRLVLNDKSGDVWEQYGPEYLKPVVEFRAEGGSVADGTYDLGTISNFEGGAIIEGLEGIGQYSLESSNGHLFLVVGSGEAVTCPEPTFAVSGYRLVDDGLLPVVSILPGTFYYGSSDVTPAIAATFNGEPVDLTALYSEDYERAEAVSGWTTPGAVMSIGEGDADHGRFFFVNTGNTNTRYAYTRLSDIDLTAVSSYTIEFDLAMKSGNTDGVEFCVMSKGGKSPSNSWGNYANINGYANMLFDITAPKSSTTFTVNGTETTTTLDSEKWYHVALKVDKESRTVAWTISNGDSGTFNLPEETSADFDGFYLVAGRYYSTIRLDNVRICRTDGASFAFPATGTLTVTTSYPGCQSATADYEVTEVLMPGDVNRDGVVNIVDVALTISYMTGQEPENFVKAAADLDSNGTVDDADLKAIVGRIGWGR